MPERETSMPFVAYGSETSLLPLRPSVSHVTTRSELNELFGCLFNVIPWSRVVAEIDDTSKSIQTVPYGDIQGLSENSITLT